MSKPAPTTPTQTVTTTPPSTVKNNHFDTFPAVSTSASTSTTLPHQLKITTEYFTHEELESHLSTLLSSYRALHPDPDLPPPPTEPSPNAARAVRRALEALFGGIVLCRPGDDNDHDQERDFFLHQEEEDILDLFMTRVRDLAIPETPRVERYPDLGTWLARAGSLAEGREGKEGTWRFVRRVT